MIKKIAITLIFCLFLYSCGKKGDPEYKESEKKLLFQEIFISRA